MAPRRIDSGLGGFDGVLTSGVAAVLLMLGVAGCEGPFIDPFREGAHFTVWGFLSTFEDTHYVRVIPVRRFPEEIKSPSDPHAEIDAVVHSTDVSTGRIVEWRHNLMQLDDRTYGHVFTAAFPVREGAHYRLTVFRSDGAFSIAETVIPESFESEIMPAQVQPDRVVQIVRWKDVPTPETIDVVYCAGPVDSRVCADGADGGGLLIRYGHEGRRVGNDWEVKVELSRDFELLREIAGLGPDVPLGLFSLQMRINALDEGWAVLADANDFAQLKALDNVLGGFGYWGAVGNSILDWFPEEEALEAIGVIPQPADGHALE